jgi:hypothetical protein
LGNKRIIKRYCHLHPKVDKEVLEKVLSYKPNYFAWSGADLFPTVNSNGLRQMVLIEVNSCPSGQKSMPFHENQTTSYRTLIENTFYPQVLQAEKDENLPKGALAVIYDKNHMEASGYAATIAEVFKEDCYLVECYDNKKNQCFRFVDGVLEIILKGSDDWIPIRACFRYVTQRPWNRIPLIGLKTIILNPILACITGGIFSII